MEEFKQRVTDLKAKLQNMSENTALLSKKVQKKSSSVLDPNDEKRIDREIEAIEHIFAENSSTLKENLKEIKKENDEIKSKNYDSQSSFDYEARHSHWQALMNKLRTECANFRNVQVTYRNLEEQKAINQYKFENPGLDEENIKRKIREDEGKGNLSAAVKGIHSKAEERNRRVKEIAKNINDLYMLIDELHEMIKGQRGMVDRIEVKMAGSAVTTTKAKENLKSALDYQRSATKIKRIILGLVIAGVIGLLVFLVFLAFKFGDFSGKGDNNKNDNNNNNNKNENKNNNKNNNENTSKT